MRVFIVISSLLLAIASHSDWVNYPDDLEQFDYSEHKLQKYWPKLAAATGLPWPDEAFIKEMMSEFPQLAEQLKEKAQHSNAPESLKAILSQNYQPLALAVQQAWRFHYQGQYQQAYELGITLAPAGLFPALYAKLIHTSYLVTDTDDKEKAYLEIDHVIAEILPKTNNFQFLIFGDAYQKARRLELMSTPAATASGLLGPTQDNLRKLHNESPNNPLYSAMLAGINAGVIERVGGFVGGLTYGADEEEAIELFKLAVKNQPDLAILYNEFAQAILRLDDSTYGGLLLEILNQCDQLIAYSAEEALNQINCRTLQSQLN